MKNNTVVLVAPRGGHRRHRCLHTKRRTFLISLRLNAIPGQTLLISFRRFRCQLRGAVGKKDRLSRRNFELFATQEWPSRAKRTRKRRAANETK